MGFATSGFASLDGEVPEVVFDERDDSHNFASIIGFAQIGSSVAVVADAGFGALVVGRAWASNVTLEPASGRARSDVLAALTGATCTARIVDTDGLTVLGIPTVVIDPSTRRLTLAMTAAQTSALVPGRYRWSVFITDALGATWPVRIPGPAVVLPHPESTFTGGI